MGHGLVDAARSMPAGVGRVSGAYDGRRLPEFMVGCRTNFTQPRRGMTRLASVHLSSMVLIFFVLIFTN
jgi:hypothetical protein